MILPLVLSYSEEITLPNSSRLVLMFVASLNLCPVVSVSFWFSDPAKSIKFSFECLLMISLSLVCLFSILIVKTE